MSSPSAGRIRTIESQSSVGDWLAVLPVVALALYVRLATLDSASLWCDEIGQIQSYYFDSYKKVMYWAARFQQPPLDYWIGWSVFKFADSDFAARLPAAIFGTLTIPVVFLLARRMVGRGVAVLVALGLAASPHMIHYSQEARPYAIFWFTLLLSVWLLTRAWERNRWRDWALFLPVIGCCLLTRSLGSLMMTAGMGLWALADLWRRFRTCRPDFFRNFFRHSGTRLSICLLIAWAPALHILEFILHRSSKFGYLAKDAAQTFDWQGNLLTLGLALKAVVTSAMPYGFVLVPLGAIGLAWYVLRRATTGADPQRVIVLPIIIGFAVHAVVYAVMVSNTVPKYVYWGYTLPFVYLGAGYVLENFRMWWHRRGHSTAMLRGMWAVLAVGLVVQLRIDHTTTIVHKPDWRAVCETIGAGIDPDRDVVFAAEAQVYGTAGMVFRVTPHYWQTDKHLVNVLRQQDKLFNAGRPILDRRDCRVALMLRCDPDLDGPRLWTSISKAGWAPPTITEVGWALSTTTADFEFHDFHQFIVLVSRRRFDTADEGLIALAGAVEQMLGDEHRELGVHLQMGLAWALAKQGRTDHAAETYAAARQHVLPEHLAHFDETYQDLAQHLSEARPAPTRLISGIDSGD